MTEISNQGPGLPTTQETAHVVAGINTTNKTLEEMAKGSFAKVHEELLYKKVLSFLSIGKGGSPRDKNKEKLAELLQNGPLPISMVSIWVDYKANRTKHFASAKSISLVNGSKAEIHFENERDGYHCVGIKSLKKATATALPNGRGSKAIVPLSAIKTIEFQ